MFPINSTYSFGQLRHLRMQQSADVRHHEKQIAFQRIVGVASQLDQRLEELLFVVRLNISPSLQTRSGRAARI